MKNEKLTLNIYDDPIDLHRYISDATPYSRDGGEEYMRFRRKSLLENDYKRLLKRLRELQKIGVVRVRVYKDNIKVVLGERHPEHDKRGVVAN